MCGIVGVEGVPGAARIALRMLERLEYRGYDSCGLAHIDQGLHVSRTVGGVAQLQVDARGAESLALGHTRWATHGKVSVANAHPHVDCTASIAVVHNGIVENHAALRAELEAAGHTFTSETDTEVIAHLLEDHARDGLLEALRRVLPRLRGSYSLVATSAHEPVLVFAKTATPLVVGLADGPAYVASDPVALALVTNRVAYLEDGDFGALAGGRLQLFDRGGHPKEPVEVRVAWAEEEAGRAGFDHYMLKEIHEAPTVLNRVFGGRVYFGNPFVDLEIDATLLHAVRRVKFLGAGTSHHAALLGAEYVRSIARLPATAELTSESKDAAHVQEEGTLYVALSQSGETLDTLEAVKKVQSFGARVLAVTNNPHSALARRSDHVLALRAGPEVSVAATKTFLAQTATVLLLALKLAQAHGKIGESELATHARDLKLLPRLLHRLLSEPEALRRAAQFLSKHATCFVLGKGINLPAAEEGALKLKELAYLHAEAYASGELKHGPFALLTPESPVVFLLPGEDPKLTNNLWEVQARGAPVILLHAGSAATAPPAPHRVAVPAAAPMLQPIVFACALHLLAYETAKVRGCAIDRPRNLAKSVTVE